MCLMGWEEPLRSWPRISKHYRDLGVWLINRTTLYSCWRSLTLTGKSQKECGTSGLFVGWNESGIVFLSAGSRRLSPASLHRDITVSSQRDLISCCQPESDVCSTDTAYNLQYDMNEEMDAFWQILCQNVAQMTWIHFKSINQSIT